MEENERPNDRHYREYDSFQEMIEIQRRSKLQTTESDLKENNAMSLTNAEFVLACIAEKKQAKLKKLKMIDDLVTVADINEYLTANQMVSASDVSASGISSKELYDAFNKIKRSNFWITVRQ